MNEVVVTNGTTFLVSTASKPQIHKAFYVTSELIQFSVRPRFCRLSQHSQGIQLHESEPVGIDLTERSPQQKIPPPPQHSPRWKIRLLLRLGRGTQPLSPHLCTKYCVFLGIKHETFVNTTKTYVI